MEASQTTGEKIKAARALEAAGEYTDAAAIYQKLFDKVPGDPQVMARLLLVYRKLKDFKHELAVLNDAIAAYQGRQKTARQKWIQAHPAAAKAGKSMLRQLEKGGALAALGGDPIVERWLKRKELVSNKLTGKKTKRPKKAEKVSLPPPPHHKPPPAPARPKAKVVQLKNKIAAKDRQRKQRDAAADRRRQQQAAATARKDANLAKKKAALERKEVAQAKKAAALAHKKEQQAQKQAELARQKAEAAAAARNPSLFVIILRYLASLDKIDAAMPAHMAYLNKHYANGDFLVSGRQVPRTGGIIIARGKNRSAIERIVKQDPFLKRNLATADIIEFSASQTARGLAIGK